jgi:hypothetical protein
MPSQADNDAGGGSPPIAYEIKSRDAAKKTVVMLSVPSDGEECPLALDSMCDAKLHFLEEGSFLADRPDLKKMTLPCGHSFAAMLLAYSFCRNGMTCPCCRAGHDGSRADVMSLPEHLHTDFNKHIQAPEAEEEEVQIIGITVPFRVRSAGNLILVVDLYETASARSVFSTHNSLVPMAQDGDFPAFLTVGRMAGLGAISHMLLMGMGLLRVSVQIEMAGESVVIDHSELLDLNAHSAEQSIRIQGVRVASREHMSMTLHGASNVAQTARRNVFDIGLRRVLRANNVTHALLDYVVWRPGAGPAIN